MKTFGVLALGLVGFVGGAVAPATAAVSTLPRFTVAMQMRADGQLIAAPKLAVAAGDASTVDVGTVPGTRYTMRFRVVPHGAETAALSSAIRVSVDGHTQVVTPSLVVRYGEPATIAFGDAVSPFRVDFTVDRRR